MGLDFDYESGCLYWSEVTKAIKAIRRQCPGNDTHEVNIYTEQRVRSRFIRSQIFFLPGRRYIAGVCRVRMASLSIGLVRTCIGAIKVWIR